MIHLWREYVNKVAIAECGARLTDKEVNVKACLVDCVKCRKTVAFRQAAKNPFWGVDLKPKDKHKNLKDPRPVKAVTCTPDNLDAIEKEAFKESSLDDIENEVFGAALDDIEKEAFG